MKNHTFSLFLVVAILFMACEDDDALTSTTVVTTIVEGSWAITYFQDSNDDETSKFNGYSFTFSTTGANTNSGVVEVSNGSTDLVGTWSVTDSENSPKLTLGFSLNPFDELSEDWRVTERTSTKIVMTHESGGNGGVDFLTLERTSL